MIKKATTALNALGLQLDDSTRMHSSSRNPVLVALDDTPTAERVLPIALTLAKRWNAPLRLVHVRNPIEDAHNMDLCLIDNGKSLSVQSRVGAYLESLAESLSDLNDLSVDSQSVTGVAIADTLRTICEKNAPRVLVMARTRRWNLSRFLTGSVTNRLMGSLTAPLLLVPAESPAENRDVASPIELNRLLVHLDGTDVSERVLDHVISIASEDTICHLRRVVPLASLYSVRRSELYHHGADDRNDAWVEMFRAREKLKRHGIKSTTRLIFDGQNLASAIVAQAKAMQALVVVAATQKHLLPSWLRSDVAENIVRRAEVPVMIVPRYGRIVPSAKESHVDNHSN